MEVDVDPAKDVANLQKHGVSLAFGAKVFEDPDVLTLSTVRVDDGERRFKAVGLVVGRLWTAVYVRRDERTRFISVRRSNGGEERAYRA